MKFNSKFKLHRALSADMYRPTMNYVYFNNGFAYASTSRILVRVRIDALIDGIDDDQVARLNNHGLHRKSFQKLLNTKADIELVDDGFRVTDRLDNVTIYKLVDFANYDGKGNSQRYPNADAIIDGVLKNKHEPVPCNAIGIMPSYLADLAAAMGTNNPVSLSWTRNDRAIRVMENKEKSEINDAVVAIIMPVLLCDE